MDTTTSCFHKGAKPARDDPLVSFATPSNRSKATTGGFGYIAPDWVAGPDWDAVWEMKANFDKTEAERASMVGEIEALIPVGEVGDRAIVILRDVENRYPKACPVSLICICPHAIAVIAV